MFSSFMQTEKPDLIVATSPLCEDRKSYQHTGQFLHSYVEREGSQIYLFNKDGIDYIHYKCKKGYEDDISLENYLLKSKKNN